MVRTHPATHTPFGPLLRQTRLAAGLSQEALAARAGLSWRTISDLERGVKQGPRAGTLRLLADALALDAEQQALLAASAFPHQGTPPSTPAVPTNLPLPLTSFIGRVEEAAAVRHLLEEHRLVTLTGAGGCGKTRLALEVARTLAEQERFADGIWLVELAPLAEGALLPRAVATVLGVRERPDQPLLARLAACLRARHTLLLLDNCEHLVAASAALADALLRVCPQLTILATSREALGIDGEQPWRVPSFELPPPLARLTLAETAARDAVRLFVQRGQVARPGFALSRETIAPVTLICRQLDGMPLAIELAAARLAVLSLGELASRLDDRFHLLTGGSRAALPRQQTLRATLDWSYELLDERERRLLGRLSVFAGGWTLLAAEAICAGEGLAAEEVLAVLAGLVAKSLVPLTDSAEGGRYHLLETVRQYAREKLDATGEAPVLQERHLEWCLALAKQAEPGLGGPEQEQWLNRLELELENIRAALAWSSSIDGHGDTGLQLAESLRWFWVTRCHQREGRRWLESLLQAGTALPLRARSLDALAELIWQQGDYKQALALFEQSFTLHTRLGNRASAAHALLARGMVTIGLGDYPRATSLIEKASPLLHAYGERHGVCWAQSGLGAIHYLRGEYTQAVALYQQCLSLFEELGDGFGAGYQIVNLANVALAMGDYDRAKQLIRESLIARRTVPAWGGFTDCFKGLAVIAVDARQPARAARLYGVAEALHEAFEHPLELVDQAAHERIVPPLRAALGDAAFAVARAEGQMMPLGVAIAYALELDPQADS